MNFLSGGPNDRRVNEQIVSMGSNLVLERPVTPQQLKELASVAKTSGASITVKFHLVEDMYLEVARTCKNHVTFVFF
jgi:hypothetical protein